MSKEFWDQGGQKQPVYYTSRALWGAKARYPQIDMMAFALVVFTRRLRPYFQTHSIKVVIDTTLKKIL